MKTVCVILLSVPLLVLALPAPHQVSPEDNEVAGRSNIEDGNWNLIAKILDDCSDKDMASCLGVKAVTALERASRMVDIEVSDGVSFVKTSDDAEARALLTEAEVQNSLDKEPTYKTYRLIDMLMEAAARFLKTHSLQFRLPQSVPGQIQRALEEARGKKKILKTLMPIILGVGAKLLLLIPAGIGLVGLIAAKAFVISKLALLLAGAIAVQKLLGGGGLGFGKNGWSSGNTGIGGWSSGGSGWNGGSAGWSSGPASSGGWSRSLGSEEAQQMAYKAQIPEQNMARSE